MQIVITARPIFNLPLTLDQIELLAKLSDAHYDGRCKAASRPGTGGFIHGWKGCATFHAENPHLDREPFTVQATWHEIDTTLKILEMCSYLPVPERAMALELQADLYAALQHADKVVPSWTDVFAGVGA